MEESIFKESRDKKESIFKIQDLATLILDHFLTLEILTLVSFGPCLLESEQQNHHNPRHPFAFFARYTVHPTVPSMTATVAYASGPVGVSGAL